VLVVREEPKRAAKPFERVLVATDFSLDAESATDLAIGLCQDFGAEFHLVHALHSRPPSLPELTLPESYFPEAARKVATERLESVDERAKKAGLEGTVNLVEGAASHAIGEFAEQLNPDLIVVGTRGHSGVTQLVSLGSVAERVLRGANCSVLVTKLTDEQA
jgi:nucleotide-binding universal stress UspA family protein